MNTSDPNVLPAKGPSGRRTFLFKVIIILLPVLAVVLAEVSLRVFHYGYNLDLFVEYPGHQEYLVMNPDASRKYFTNQAIAPTGNTELFKKEKGANTFRVFVLGESTTIGYPYLHNASFHRWLKYRLLHTFPEKEFEIINLSLTAVNSYTIHGFAKEIVAHNPDAVMIYTGHNEYYGTLGVGSTENMGSNPMIVNFMLKLRSLRLVQLMTNVCEKITGAEVPTEGETRMRLMVAEEKIQYGSDLYNKGVEQFKYNMNATLRLLQEHNIPVLISNVVSNEKDLKPFVSYPPDSLQFPGFFMDYDDGVKAFGKNRLSYALSYFREANHRYNQHALCNYHLGQLSWRQQDFPAAKEYFARAKDMDGLRFRAPAMINEVISELCNTYPNAHLVDTKTVFERWSADRIIGHELILEHVHPTLTGYALLSDAFYEAMKHERMIVVAKDREMSLEQLLRSMPVTKVDSLAGLYKISMLKKSWPFSETLQDTVTVTVATEEEKLAWKLASQRMEWEEAMDSLYLYYTSRNNLGAAEKLMEGMALEYPEDPAFYEKVAMLSGELGDQQNAVLYFKRSFGLSPTFGKARYLFVLFLKLDKPMEAIPYIDYAIRNNTSGFNLGVLREKVMGVIQLQQAYQKDSTDVSALNNIADAYLKMENEDGASKYIRKALLIDHANENTRSLSARIIK